MLKLPLYSIVLALILIAVCGSSSAQTTQSDSSQTHAVKALDANISNGRDTPASEERRPRYQLQPSDILAISFPLSPELNLDAVTVQPDGYITLPYVGSIYVKGDTVPHVVDTLTKAYATTLHNPIVAVDVTNFQVGQFTVSGQVGKPGQYPLRYDTTVAEGIAVAGGFLPTAKTQVFLFHRVSPDLLEVKKLNTKQLLNGHKVKEEDVHLQQGDMIFVPDKFIANFRKYVPYTFGFYSGLSFNGTNLLTQ